MVIGVAAHGWWLRDNETEKIIREGHPADAGGQGRERGEGQGRERLQDLTNHLKSHYGIPTIFRGGDLWKM